MSATPGDVLAQFQNSFFQDRSADEQDVFNPSELEHSLAISALQTAGEVTARSSDEDLFHHVVQSHFQHFGFNTACGVDDFASFADRMAHTCQLKYEYVSQAATLDRALAISTATTPEGEAVTGSTANALRAERELWSLLQMMSSADVLKPLDHKVCQAQLERTLQELPITATIPDFINAAFQADDRLKKDEILKAWLERSVQDRVVSIPVPSLDPGHNTLKAISNKAGKVLQKSIHPDAQFSKDGMMMALAGDDKVDQEQLWQLIWQLVRSGQLTEAQQVAHEHRVYWLAASLRGVDNHYYTMLREQSNGEDDAMDVDEEQRRAVSRIGNLRQPVWARTCWKYADNLRNNQLNWKTNAQDATSAGLLEMSIYASLSNHSQVLLSSPYIQSWHDKVWVYLKAVYQMDMNHVIHTYRQRKVEHSQFYPGCNDKVVEAERQLMDMLQMSLKPLSLNSTDDIFKQVSIPTAMNAESILIHLQATMMQGYHGMKALVDSGIWLQWLNQDCVLRVLCHLLLWIRFSPEHSADQFKSLISEDLFYRTLEAYMRFLIRNQHYHLVGQYCVYLNRGRRIQIYAELLLAIQRTNLREVQAGEVSRVLAIADLLFAEDVLEILRVVVSTAPQYLLTHPVDSDSQALVVVDATKKKKKLFNREEEIDGVLGSDQLYQVLALNKPNVPRKLSAAQQATQNKTVRAAVPPHAKLWFDCMDDLQVKQEEKMRMESLRWLLQDPQHSFEALSQANRLMVQLLCESSVCNVGLVRVVLDDYLRSDIKDVGDDLLSDEERSVAVQVEKIRQATSARFERDNSEMDFLQRMLETKAGMWNSNTTKLHLWHRFVTTIQTLQVWQDTVGQFHQQRSGLLGDESTVASCLATFYGQLQKIGEESIAALQSLLEYSHDEHMESVNGYKELWEQAHAAARARIDILLQDSMASLATVTTTTNRSVDDASLVQAVSEAVEKIQASLPAITNEDYPTDRIRNGLEQIQELSQSPNLSGDTLLKTVHILQEVSVLVEEIVDELNLQGTLLNKVITAYLTICHEMASLMLVLEKEDDAVRWYQDAIDLSILLANEDHSLQLYTLLDTDAMERIVQEINRAAMSMLELQPAAFLPER